MRRRPRTKPAKNSLGANRVAFRAARVVRPNVILINGEAVEDLLRRSMSYRYVERRDRPRSTPCGQQSCPQYTADDLRTAAWMACR